MLDDVGISELAFEMVGIGLSEGQTASGVGEDVAEYIVESLAGEDVLLDDVVEEGVYMLVLDFVVGVT